jgi:putative ATPase
MIECPICSKPVKEANINTHIDGNCETFIEDESGGEVQRGEAKPSAFTSLLRSSGKISNPVALTEKNGSWSSRPVNGNPAAQPLSSEPDRNVSDDAPSGERPAKRLKKSSNLAAAAPLADRMRPRTLDEVRGQALVSRDGVLRGLIETNRVPSMILWGGAGTGKTTIARLIAQAVGARFVEINSTSSGVAECKKIFTEARSELSLTGRKTILFCDEIHRFSKTQQDVFLGPVESGQITLVGATTENPSFKVQAALLSRCRTFTLSKLPDEEIRSILKYALEKEGPNYSPSSLVDDSLLTYLSAFADGDARTALNLLELAMETSKRPGMTLEQLKASLTQTLVYDRAGDQHYDTISAFHKSVRGSDPDAALYYLARMIASGEDARFIARRMVVMASEDVGLADNTLLPLATAAYDAAEKIGWPEARIPLAHVTVALALAKKSTRAYRALGNAERLLKQPGMAGLPIPMHLRNAPTRLMKELGYGKQYKYNPDFVEGKCSQEYLPEKLRGVKFLEDRDLGTEEDPELEEGAAGDVAEQDDVQAKAVGKKGIFTELSLQDVMSSMS